MAFRRVPDSPIFTWVKRPCPPLGGWYLASFDDPLPPLWSSTCAPAEVGFRAGRAFLRWLVCLEPVRTLARQARRLERAWRRRKTGKEGIPGEGHLSG